MILKLVRCRFWLKYLYVYAIWSICRVLTFIAIHFRVQDESLRWLVANGKKEAADKVIHKVARWNKINYDDLKIIVDKRMASTEQNTQKADKNGTTTENTPQEKLAVEKYSIVTILKHRRILITSLIMWFTW